MHSSCMGLPILTAQPSAEEMSRVPNHLIGVKDIAERCDAGWYGDVARRAIEEIHSRGRRVIIVGGTGF